MTFTFDAWQFFRFAQPELINAYLCVCCWAVDALYLPENKRQRALCRRTPCVWYASTSTWINASRCFLFVFLTWQKQKILIFLFCLKKVRYSHRPPIGGSVTMLLNHMQLNSVSVSPSRCSCRHEYSRWLYVFFTKLVHSTHRHLVGGGCSQDNLFRLARLKAVIYHERYSPSSDGIPTAAANHSLSPAAFASVTAYGPLWFSPVWSGGDKISQHEEGSGRHVGFTNSTSAFFSLTQCHSFRKPTPQRLKASVFKNIPHTLL